MSDVVVFIPRHEDDGAKNLNEFINYAKNDLTLFEEQGGFDVDEWKFFKKMKFTVVFSQLEVEKKDRKNNYHHAYFEEPYLSFAKAYMRNMLTNYLKTSFIRDLNALRYVYAALIEIHGKPDILLLDGETLKKTAELTEKYAILSPAVMYRFGQGLESFYNAIRKNKIVIELPEWKNPWKRPRERSQGTSETDKNWQGERCPSMHQMLCIAEAFNKAETIKDKYASSVIMLLCFAPGRQQEINYLTTDCLTIEEYEDDGETKKRLGVRWNSAKGFGETIKWVPKTMEPVVEEVVSRLIEIGDEARKVAKFHHENSNKFYIHSNCITPDGFGQDEPLTPRQIHAALGIRKHPRKSDTFLDARDYSASVGLGNSAFNKIFKVLHSIIEEKRYATYRDLAHLYAHSTKSNFPFINGTKIPIWNSLCLTWQLQHHKKAQTKYCGWELATLNREFINDQLDGRKSSRGGNLDIFYRMGMVDEDGSPIKLTSHQLRVWLSTNAERGNLDSLELAQWAGRSRPQDNVHYDLRTREEKRARELEVLNVGQGETTALQQAKINQVVSYTALGHKDRLGMAEITKWGFCEHDFAMEPCTKAANCLTCKEHCVIKGLTENLEQIKIEEKLIEAEFERAKEAEGLNYFGASRWVDHYGYRLALIRTQRVKLEDPETPEGAILRIPQEFDPSQTKRALQNAGYETNLGDDEERISEDYLKTLMVG